MTAGGLLILASVPAAAVPVSDTLGASESLTVVVIHGGPACSSGSHQDASGACVSDETVAPPAWLPALDGQALALGAAWSEDPLVPTPEPGTLLLVGTALASLGAWYQRRRE